MGAARTAPDGHRFEPRGEVGPLGRLLRLPVESATFLETNRPFEALPEALCDGVRGGMRSAIFTEAHEM